MLNSEECLDIVSSLCSVFCSVRNIYSKKSELLKYKVLREVLKALKPYNLISKFRRKLLSPVSRYERKLLGNEQVRGKWSQRGGFLATKWQLLTPVCSRFPLST